MSDLHPSAQNDLLDSLLGDFLDESDQLLTQLNERLLQLDEWVRTMGADHRQTCDASLLNEMFRAAHSLKGLSAMLGLTDINNLTHKIENVFDAARKDELTVNGDVTELVFMGLDQLSALIDRLKDPDSAPVDCSAVVDAIRRLLQSTGAERQQTSQAEAEKAMRANCIEECPAPLAAAPQAADPPPAGDADPLAGLQDEDGIPERYLSIFIDESEAALDGLTGALLALESGGNGDDLKGLMGTAHKIKGSAASIGLNRIAKLAHLMEDLLQGLLESNAPLSAAMIDVLLKCTDAMQRYVGELKQGAAHSDHFGQLAGDLLAVRPGGCSADTPAQLIYRGEVRFQPDFPATSLKAQVLCERLAKLGELSECNPSPEQLDAVEQLDCFRFLLATDRGLETIEEQLRIAGVLDASVEPLAATAAETGAVEFEPATADRAATPPELPSVPAPRVSTPKTPQADGGPRTADAAQRPTETVRVDIDRLDHLMDLAGQLVINRAQFAQVGEKLGTALGCKQSAQALNRLSAELDKMGSQLALQADGERCSGPWDGIRACFRRIQHEVEPLRREMQAFSRARDLVGNLFEALHQLGRVSDGIQQSVMDTRMVPIGPLFARFKRVVRDITRSSAKQARLEIRGESTELDKRMIDELGDPLVHLVRNSVDHGIELPEVREAAGKPREGTVTLDACHRGNSILIEVRDDGRGLDAGRILQKCLDKGLLTDAEAQQMTAPQIYQKIWEPGLSTAEKVTEVSGRGMGMDIVKTKIEELSGTVDIDSVPGRGTTITIKLPLTLAILPSLMVEIGADVFALPIETVAEIVRVSESQLSSVQGRRMAALRGRVVPLLRLGDLLAFHGAAPPQFAETTLVILGDEGKQFGLAVDRVIGEEDVVIKSIAENFDNVRGIAGAGILGNGRVALVLDIAGLVGVASKKAACSLR